ncbi:hypothetical protein OB955_10205 [Halobacteria archaeon AArc-m2/3/4]|uniref:Sec-independent protein translocase protein TatA n=1 Tax=Natronoglomus mannanivorans TaxID=2979990 RepID=A0ABT2QDY8_9EURY|nr:hypothetical protein [Halobacteria archaeon AArc-m2/3/4]
MFVVSLAFVPVPGGPELLVIGGIRLYRNRNGGSARERELEQRVEDLERQVESLQSDDE